MSEEKPKQRRRLVVRHNGARRALVTIGLVGMFLVGLNVGNGRISLPSQSASPSSTLPATLDYSSVNHLYSSLKSNYDGKLSEQQLINGLKHGLAEATNDPYTSYFTPAEADEFQNTLNNTFSGIGAELGKNESGAIQVIAPIAGTPADKAGVRANDIIASINGKTTAGMSVDEAVKNIRGEAGTKVKLQLVRGTEPVKVIITRQTIKQPSVTSKTLEGNIGYIQIISFADDTAELVDKAARDFKAAGTGTVILDMRNNPGGQVDAATSVASQWLPAGALIMQEKQGKTVLQTYQSTGSAGFQDMPTVILTNGGSASASEIVAAAIHDNQKGYIIGEKTYGKGVVQRIIPFRDGSELKGTIASWYRPNGKNINKRGIAPDQKVELTQADADAANDVQLKAAQDYLSR